MAKVSNDRAESEPESALELRSSSMQFLKDTCDDIERLVENKFPGLSMRTSVWFFNAPLARNMSTPLSWNVNNTANASLGTILKLKDFDQRIYVHVLDREPGYRGRGIATTVRSVFGEVRHTFFLSHFWGDNSVQESADGKKLVMQSLVELLETHSNETVWLDQNELAEADQYQSQMHEGIVNAKCVIICLSHGYLASMNCLNGLWKGT